MNKPINPYPQSKLQQTFQRLMQDLPGAPLQDSVTAASNLADDESVYQRLRSDLPASCQHFFDAKQLEEAATAAEEEAPDVRPHWCLCEMVEGEFPKVRIFRTRGAMSAHMASLEGQEVAVWPFYGIPLRFTAPNLDGIRYLVLPGGTDAFVIHESTRFQSTLPFMAVDDDATVDGEAVKFQNDGWLGDPCLSESPGAEFYLRNSKAKPRLPAPANNSDEEDDDDSEDTEDNSVEG